MVFLIVKPYPLSRAYLLTPASASLRVKYISISGTLLLFKVKEVENYTSFILGNKWFINRSSRLVSAIGITL
jgi:hypothetical protein